MRHTAHNGISSATRQREAGFTLLELLVAMTILSIIGAAIFTMFHQSSEMYSRTIAQTRQYLAAREAISLMASELREARLVPNATYDAAGNIGAFWGYASGGPAGSNKNEVYFVAPTGMRPDTSKQDLCVLGYWLTNDGKDDTPENLMRYCYTSERPDWKYLRPYNVTTNSEKLGVLVRKLTFEYWGPNDDAWDASDSGRYQWLSPSEHDLLPRAVRITLVVVDPRDPGETKKDKAFTTVVTMDNAGY